MTTEALTPAAAEPAVVTGGGGEIVLPQVIVDAGPAAVGRFLEFFAGRIANARTRAAYGRAVGQFLGWCEARGPPPPGRLAAPRSRLHPNPPGIGPHGEAAPGRDPHARRLARRQPGAPREPRLGRARPRSTSSPRGRRPSFRRRRRGSSLRRSTRAPWPGSGTAR